jgi:hypothetical protein
MIFKFKYEEGQANIPGTIAIEYFTGNPQKILNDIGNNYSYLLSGRRTPIIGFSATAYFPDSTNSHVIGNILGYHPDIAVAESIKIDEIRLSDPVKVSGSLKEERKEHLQDLTYQLEPYLDIEIAFLLKNCKDRDQILLVTNSYDETIWVGEALLNTSYRRKFSILLNDDHIASLKSEELKECTIAKVNVEDFAIENNKKNILVAPLAVIGRELNILNNDSVAAIGSIYLLVRTLPNPDKPDMELTYLCNKYMTRIDSNKFVDLKHPGMVFLENSKLLHFDQNDYQNSMVPFCKIPSQDVQLGIVSDILVELIQLLGRGRRGFGYDDSKGGIRLYFVDGAFLANPSWKSLIRELILRWKVIPEKWTFLYSLYKPIFDNLMIYAGIPN